MKIFFLTIFIVTLPLFSEERIHSSVFYGALTHQHHDFYQTAFSYQGVETGVSINHHLLAAVYGATFVSLLETSTNNTPAYLQLWQSGAILGITTNDSLLLHAGFLLTIGYLSVVRNTSTFPLFRSTNPEISESGLVVTPQLFGETNITHWLKIRMGIGYDLYSLTKETQIQKKDIQSISFNFGFIFGNFKESRKL